MTKNTHSLHIIPVSIYLTIAGILITLTAVTVMVAQYDLGAFNLLVAMIIAAVKGTLVALFFMHLKYTNKLYSIILVGAITMVSLFIIFVMFDTMARGQVNQIRSGVINNKAIIYQNSTVIDSNLAPAQDSLSTDKSDSSKVDSSTH